MAVDPRPPGFAPDDPNDGRERGEWKTRYLEDEARGQIRWEARAMAAALVAWVGLTLALFTGRLADLLLIAPSVEESFLRYSAAALGGLLGGTLISIKWLYHTVAKGLWNEDRRLWRLFTPLQSAGLAFGVILLISAELVSIFESDAINSPSTCMAIGFIVGLFSDSAIAKLKEVALTLFGATESHR